MKLDLSSCSTSMIGLPSKIEIFVLILRDFKGKIRRLRLRTYTILLFETSKICNFGQEKKDRISILTMLFEPINKQKST